MTEAHQLSLDLQLVLLLAMGGQFSEGMRGGDGDLKAYNSFARRDVCGLKSVWDSAVTKHPKEGEWDPYGQPQPGKINPVLSLFQSVVMKVFSRPVVDILFSYHLDGSRHVALSAAIEYLKITAGVTDLEHWTKPTAARAARSDVLHAK